ncbi:hypothetical protein [Nocardioides xinjiangensis]|uniref:hypothetical protein n=1 Tax=Nocardioides xinjiangensis TaxID=2817376 RepID=UPI001B311599|nr:hypothetical protein [Nocardioides sp. SYSU D00514]
MRSVLADHQTSKAGRPRLWAAGLSAFAAVLVIMVLVVLLVRGGDRYEVDPRRVEVARPSPAAAATALATFVSGVETRDAAVLTSLAPDEDEGAKEVLAGVAANAASLELSDVSARYVDQVGTVATDGTWAAVAELGWRVAGDAAPSRADVVVRFAPDAEGVGVVGFGGAGAGRVPLWLRGELSVARAPGVLVMVDGAWDEAVAVVRRVTRGTAVVRRVLPAWRAPVVVEVPASSADLDEALGAAAGTYAGIAAVTASAGGSSDGDAPVHVFVNPEVTAGLSRAGAQVVMSHELVHVATDAARGGIEPWLVEGFADYVALRDTALPDRTILGRAIAAARAEGVPTSLPEAARFDTRADALQARYEEAWLACRIIAEKLGERALVAAYNDVRAGTPVASALAGRGMAERALLKAWRWRLTQLVAETKG